MSRRGLQMLSGFIIVLIFYSIAVGALMAADASRLAQGMDEVLYLPNEKLLAHFTAGLHGIVADLLWLNCIQYTAEEHRGQRLFTWLEHMLTTSVRLDPYFVDVYRFGALLLTTLREDAEAGLNLAHAGMLKNPHAWQLPYEAGMVYLTSKREEPNARYLAALYLNMSTATGKAPGGIANLTAKLQDEFDLTEVEQDMWREMLQSEDAFLRELAERKLLEIELRRTCRAINEMLNTFLANQGKPAASLDDLVAAGMLRAVPEDPLGGKFFIGLDGLAYNTTLLDDKVIRTRNSIHNALDEFFNQHDCWPSTLDALISAGYLAALPKHPYPDGQWHYDPATGQVE